MIITKLYIDTFGGISNREAQFQPGLNVVVGANETGKSTMFHAMQHVLLTPVALNKRTFEKTMEPFLPVGGGDTIAAEVQFNKNKYCYILKKKWGATSEALLRLDDGSSITDEDAIKNRLSELLPAEEGTLKSVFMTYQSGLSNTLAELRDQPETIRSFSDILRKAVMEMDGISVTAFIDELRRRCSEYLEHWDIERKRPERVEGIMFLFFLLLMIQAIIEREVRLRMKEQGIKTLPIYPEFRDAYHPTTSKILYTFEGISSYQVRLGREMTKEFRDSLTETQQKILDLLGISLNYYWGNSFSE